MTWAELAKSWVWPKTILSQIWAPQGEKIHNLTEQLVFKYPHSKFFLHLKITSFISISAHQLLSSHCLHSGWLHTYSSRHITAWLQHLYPPIRYVRTLINSSIKPALLECKKPQLLRLSWKPFIILVILQRTCPRIFMSLFHPRAQHWTHHPDVSHQCWGQRNGHLSWPVVMFCLMQPGWLLVFFAARAQCWLMVSLVSIRIPRPFSATLTGSTLLVSLQHVQVHVVVRPWVPGLAFPLAGSPCQPISPSWWGPLGWPHNHLVYPPIPSTF